MQNNLSDSLWQSQTDGLDVRHERHLLQITLEAEAVIQQETSDQLDSTVQQLLTDLQAARAANVSPSFLSHALSSFVTKFMGLQCSLQHH